MNSDSKTENGTDTSQLAEHPGEAPSSEDVTGPNDPDRSSGLRERLRQAARDPFVFDLVLRELSESELNLLDEICAKYREKRDCLEFTLVGPYPRPDLDSLPRRWLRRLTHRTSAR
jgi:hypothetical protein